jgi:hypothetical protein
MCRPLATVTALSRRQIGRRVDIARRVRKRDHARAQRLRQCPQRMAPVTGQNGIDHRARPGGRWPITGWLSQQAGAAQQGQPLCVDPHTVDRHGQHAGITMGRPMVKRGGDPAQRPHAATRAIRQTDLPRHRAPDHHDPVAMRAQHGDGAVEQAAPVEQGQSLVAAKTARQTARQHCAQNASRLLVRLAHAFQLRSGRVIHGLRCAPARPSGQIEFPKT